MPEPRSDETRQEFLDRCMSDSESVNDFPENDQRYAFCVSQWDNRNKNLFDKIKKIDALKKDGIGNNNVILK